MSGHKAGKHHVGANFNVGDMATGSVISLTGSTRFGDTSDDSHEFTGSMYISGVLQVGGVGVAADGVSGSGPVVDDAIVRWSGTTGTLVSGSGVVIDDNDNVLAPANVFVTSSVKAAVIEATSIVHATGSVTGSNVIASTLLYSSGSIDISGSSRFGNESTNTHQFTGSIYVTGEVLIDGTAAVTSSTFLGLTDTTSSYVGNAGKIPMVNSVEDAIEFQSPGLWRYFDATNLPTAAASPEAVWQFDGSGAQLTDRVNNHDLTEIDGDTIDQCGVEGLIGILSRDSRRFSVGTPAPLVTTGSFTIEFIAQLAGSAISGDASMFIACTVPANEDEAGNTLYAFEVTAGGLFTGFHEYSTGNNEVITFNAGPPIGPVFYLAFTRSANGLTHKVYGDGQLLDTQVASNAPTGGANAIPRIMADLSAGLAAQFNGSLFSARFTIEEWSAAQVLEAYQYVRKLII